MTKSVTTSTGIIDPDATLVRRYRTTGEKGAFEGLFRKYQGPIYALVHRMVGGEDAYDITQEVFLRALRSIGSFRGECSFRTWLYTIARHICYNHCRDLKRRNAQEEGLGWDPDGSDETMDDLPDPHLNVEKIAETRELQRAAGRILAAMSPEQRLLISLRDFDGMTYEEIVAITELPLSSVKSKLHRARLAFKKMFQPYMDLLDDYFQE
ncbi:MAG: sigma-70 family RNA polymerase sigma factor [Capsulimonadaceae bacterium]|nr:sigma-70 family RNA polymerase sigma factor [Capsulimonadaceae bacterium]